MSRRRGDQDDGPGGGHLPSLVGWIFADVLLALAVVFLATQSGGAMPRVEPATTDGTTTTTTTTTTTPPTTTTTAPPGVDSRFICFRVRADGGVLTGPASAQRDQQLDDLEAQVRARLAQPDLSGRRAGIVLSFGVADEPGPGRQRAEVFNDEILPRFSETFRRTDGSVVAKRAFWDGQPTATRPAGSIMVNIYPLVDADHGPLGPHYEQVC
jgi:hypothetical protein